MAELLKVDNLETCFFSKTGHTRVIRGISYDINRKETLGKMGDLAVEDNIDENVIAELKKRGHKVRTFSGANSHPIMLYVDPKTGMMYAAGDPRVGRHAAVLESNSP